MALSRAEDCICGPRADYTNYKCWEEVAEIMVAKDLLVNAFLPFFLPLRAELFLLSVSVEYDARRFFRNHIDRADDKKSRDARED
jgi:hypothetical protein